MNDEFVRFERKVYSEIFIKFIHQMKKQKINWLELVLQLFVVFVGVTLGFFVNDWATKRNNTNLETVHLLTLVKDIDTNYSSFKHTFKKDSIWLSRSKEIINSAADKTIQPLDSIDAISDLIGSYEKSLFQTNTFQTLLSTGEINLLKDIDLKYALNNYHSNTIGAITILEDRLFNFTISETTELAMKYTLKTLDKDFANEAISVLSVIYDLKKSLNPLYKNAQAESKALLYQIDESSKYVKINFEGDLKREEKTAPK